MNEHEQAVARYIAERPMREAIAQVAMAERTGKRANWGIAHAIKGTMITWTVKGVGELSLDLTKLSEPVKARGLAHGMVQRVSDAAAIPRDSKTGASATPQEKFDAMKALCEHYASGSEDWSRRGEAAVRESGPGALLREALVIAKPEKSAEVVAAFVKGLKPAQVAALLASEQLKEAVTLAREAQEAKVREAIKGAGVDAEALLGGL